MKLSAKKKVLCGTIIACITGMAFLAGGCAGGRKSGSEVDRIIAKMSMDEKISQMIVPAIRTFDDENVTELDKAPELKEALRKHQYGGIILFGQNITGTEQVTRLLYDLQENNAAAEGVSTHIPYLTPVDEEGGIVIRLISGTRMTGNMAIGATDNAEENAEKTGEIIGKELAAAGFNTDYAPVIDVNNNPANPVIGTRSFSDDPETAALLGNAYKKGLNKSSVIATFKHFPGHGDTGVDSHIGTPSVEKTYEEIQKNELIPFKAAIENGADMIMTAHITYPLIDDEVTYGDGKTKGYYPATMSKKMITDILRNDMGYNGVVVTDALEMDAIRTAGLVEGAEDSAEYRVNIAEKVINAGVDILLIPTDMKDKEAVVFYDEYISKIEDKVASGEIDKERIDESVRRILLLKSKYGILDTGKEKEDIEVKVSNSLQIIGSKSHHDTEAEIAGEAVTLLKNDEGLIPLSDDVKKIELLGRLEGDAATVNYAVDEMRKKGLISDTAEVSFDHYLSEDKELIYTDDMKERIASADVVIGFSYAAGTNILNKEDPAYAAIMRAMEDAHKADGKFILLSENLPYDAAVFQDADSIILSYMGAGLDTDPTEKIKEPGTGSKAINANILAAIETVFGSNSPKGKLPVNIPAVKEKKDGSLEYGTEILYEKGAAPDAFGNAGEKKPETFDNEKKTDDLQDENVRITLSREGYTLEQALVLSRHNIRAPLSGAGSALDTITPHKWFDWSAEASQLSVRGGTLETEMGQYFRKWLEAEGLFEPNYRPEDEAVRIYANSKQRTIATARFFSTGLLPVHNMDVEYHAEFDTMDPVFNPVLTYASDDYVKDADEEMHETFDPVIGALNDNYELLGDVIDVKESEDFKSGNFNGFMTDDSEFVLEEGKEPGVSGSLKQACQISDALVLQYFEETDRNKAAFGHDLSDEDWEAISEIKDVYGDTLFTVPSVAVNVAHPLLEEMEKELTTDGRQFTFLCGHDSNLASVFSALRIEDFSLPGTIEKKTPIGAKFVISRWKNDAGEELISLDLVYQKTEQLRSLSLLDDNNPPGIYSLRIKGLKADENGMYKLDEVLERFSDAIEDYDRMKDRYELEKAA